jgi:hypothetical protein
MKIKYSDGSTSIADDFPTAMEEVRGSYPDAVAYQVGYETVDDDGIVGDRHIMVWVDKESSVGDGGSNAIAVIEE